MAGLASWSSEDKMVAESLLAGNGDEKQASYGAVHRLPHDMTCFKQLSGGHNTEILSL
jgi:hypothetical protein